MSTPARALLFARVSTTTQSYQMQLQHLKSAALRRGWIIAHTIIETAGGAEAHRKALNKLRDHLINKDIDVVAVWRLDRLARSARELLALIDSCRLVGVDLVSLTESIDTGTPEAGRMILAIVGAMAEFEKNLIGERIHAGIADAKGRGFVCRRPALAPETRETITRLRSDGLSFAQIADVADVSLGTAHKYGHKIPILKKSSGL